jgi:competence protein ComEA
LAGLDRVSGVGPGLLKVLTPYVVFSGSAGPGTREAGGGGGADVVVSGALNINSATVAELDALPGVGPAKAAAILQYRKQHGPFTRVEELARVPGFGAAAASRLRDAVTVR